MQRQRIIIDVVEKRSRPRFSRWGSGVVIYGDGGVRFHERSLNALPIDAIEEPRVLVGNPDNKTLIFQFISTEYVNSQEFRTACEGKDIYPYKFTAGKKGIHAKQALGDTNIREILDTMIYYKSKSSKGVEYPDALTFTDPVVDADKKTITISTDNIEQKLPTDSQKDSDVIQ